MAQITQRLSTNIPPAIGAQFIYDENYWKRCCVEKYDWNCNLAEHGLLWKQLYFERLVQEKLEDFDFHTDDEGELHNLLESCMDYIFTVTFRQFPSHLNLSELLSPTKLPNLTKLDITYGVKKIGMNYERMLFGMKISDANSLAKVVADSSTLTTLIMSGNMVDDDLLRMLIAGLMQSDSITHLDVSHNKITNHGARLLSKLLGDNSVLTVLNLADNQIHAEGGRYLARGLRENDSLLELNMRLNRLTDEGCRLLLDGLNDKISLQNLNLGSNGAGQQAAQCLMSIFSNKDHRLETLDISGNEFTGAHYEDMVAALSRNKRLCSIDLRRNPGYADAPRAVQEIERVARNNEYQARRAGGHP
jgi:hypothetical protein